MGKLVIGLDLGTTLCKASAYALNGDLIGSAQKTVSTFRPHPGWVEQNPDEWREAILTVLKKLVMDLGEKAEGVTAIGLSTHGPSVILTDERFRPLQHCPIWQDQRAAHLTNDLIEKAGIEWIGLGTPESSFGVQLYWLILNKPEILKKAAYILDVKGYVLACLTGRAVDEPSSSPDSDVSTQSLFKTLDIDPDKLAKTQPSLSVVGYLVPEIQEQVKLPAMVNVVAGLNDGAAATLGAGIVDLGQGIVSLSTNGVMRTTVQSRMPGKILIENSMFCYSYVNDMFVTGGMTKCGGDSVSWLIETFYQDRRNDPSIFDEVAREALQCPPGANGVIFMPYLVGMGTPTPTNVPQGAFVNLGRHHNRAAFTRALLEGVAFALRDIGEKFDELGLPWENLRFSGGGSKNLTWRQIVADILGKPLSPTRADSVLGSAIMAATGVGFFDNVKDGVRSMVPKGTIVEPISENTRFYEQFYEKFKRTKRALELI
ncbi:MAG: hypothetical protein HPY59_00515 [Anaerolineae bacterium]|nr:hypothetical protein [Anaerolineae bacterium]